MSRLGDRGGAQGRPLPDTYTNHNHPEAGKAAVRVLEAAGVHVRVPDGVGDTGRPAFSKGFLEKARNTAVENVEALAPLAADGWDVVVIEPSDAVMFQSDYLDLLADDAAEMLASATYGVCEYVDSLGLDENLAFDSDVAGESLTYHGHCHQKATRKDHHAVGVLRRAGYEVDPLDSGCCGMAGSFGYEAEHASMSDAIASILYEQVAESDGDRVVAPARPVGPNSRIAPRWRRSRRRRSNCSRRPSSSRRSQRNKERTRSQPQTASKIAVTATKVKRNGVGRRAVVRDEILEDADPVEQEDEREDHHRSGDDRDREPVRVDPGVGVVQPCHRRPGSHGRREAFVLAGSGPILGLGGDGTLNNCVAKQW